MTYDMFGGTLNLTQPDPTLLTLTSRLVPSRPICLIGEINGVNCGPNPTARKARSRSGG